MKRHRFKPYVVDHVYSRPRQPITATVLAIVLALVITFPFGFVIWQTLNPKPVDAPAQVNPPLSTQDQQIVKAAQTFTAPDIIWKQEPPSDAATAAWQTLALTPQLAPRVHHHRKHFRHHHPKPYGMPWGRGFKTPEQNQLWDRGLL